MINLLYWVNCYKYKSTSVEKCPFLRQSTSTITSRSQNPQENLTLETVNTKNMPDRNTFLWTGTKSIQHTRIISFNPISITLMRSSTLKKPTLASISIVVVDMVENAQRVVVVMVKRKSLKKLLSPPIIMIWHFRFIEEVVIFDSLLFLLLLGIHFSLFLLNLHKSCEITIFSMIYKTLQNKTQENILLKLIKS